MIISGIIAFLSALVGALSGWLMTRYPRKTLTKKENAEANGIIGENYRNLLDALNIKIGKLECRIKKLEQLVNKLTKENVFLQSENIAYREKLNLPIDSSIYEKCKTEIDNRKQK